MAELAPVIKHKFTDSNDEPLAGGKLYSYVAGTTTPLATYTDRSGVSANTNPIILDANGECNLWISAASNYKFVLTDSADVVQYTVDNVGGSSNNANTDFETLAVDNLFFDGNTISTTDTNGNLILSPNGTGKVRFTSATASTVPYFDANKDLVSSGVTPTELGYVSGVTSAIQTQLDAKTTALTNHEADTTTHGTSGAIVGTSDTQTLSNKTLTSPAVNGANFNFGTASDTNRLLLPKDTTSNLGALTDTEAALAFDTTTGKPVFNDGGGWVEVGSGAGGSSINYAQDYYNGDTVADIIASTGLTATVNTASSPLGAGTCIRLSKDAVNRSGSVWSIPLSTIQLGDTEGGKPLIFSVMVRTSANYASNDIRWRVFDNTAADYINVRSYQSSSGHQLASPDATTFVGAFDTTEGSLDLELRPYVDSTNASAYDIDIIRLKVTPEQTVPGPIGEYLGALTTTGSWVSNTTYSGKYWRDKDHLIGKVLVSLSGAPTSAALTLTLPNSLQIDSAKMQFGGNNLAFAEGTGSARDTGTNSWFVYPRVDSSALTTISVFYANGATTSITNSAVLQNAPFTFASGDTVEITYRVPISGWAASTALSTTETMLRGARARYYTTAGPAQTAAVSIINYATKDYDTHNAVTTGASWKFTAPQTNVYRVTFGAAFASSVANQIYYLYKNGSVYARLVQDVTTASPQMSGSAEVYLSAGDYVDVRVAHGSATTNLDTTSTNNYITISPVFDLSVFSTYGTFELKTATSATKTPSATNNYHALSGNSITLTPGTWKLFGSATFSESGSATYSSTGLGFTSANGADTTSAPADLSSASGLTILSAVGVRSGLHWYNGVTSGGHLPTINVGPIIVRVTQSVTVYLVSYAQMTTAANARITVYANAERLQ